MKTFPLLILLLILSSVAIHAQDEAQPQPTADPQIYQLYLDEEVESIDRVEYKKDGVLLKFELGRDGQTVYLYDYAPGNTVIVTVRNRKGGKVEVQRTSCYIDPVIQS
jgi:hypothetical protein